jgi:hypothetical protein
MGAGIADGVARRLALVAAEIVEDDDIAGIEGRRHDPASDDCAWDRPPDRDRDRGAKGCLKAPGSGACSSVSRRCW